MPSDAHKSAFRKASLHILPVLFFTYFINYLDRVNVSFAGLSMEASLSLDQKVVGLAMGLFFIGYILFEVPSNLLLYRYGARRWLALLTVFWAVITFLTAFITNKWEFYALRFGLGLAECGFFPGVILYLTWWYPKVWRVRIVAGFLTAIPISQILGGPVSGWIMHQSSGWLRFEDWRWLFIIESIPCLFIALWIFKGLVDRPSQARWLTQEEKDVIEQTLARENAGKEGGHSSKHGLEVFSNPKVWLLSVLYFCQMMGLYGLSFWLPKIIKGMGWKDLYDIGRISAIPWVLAIVIMLIMSSRADKTGAKRPYAIAAALLGAAGFFASACFDNVWLRLFALGFAASGVLSLMAIAWSFPAALLTAEAAAAGIAMINSIGNIAGFVNTAGLSLIDLNLGMALTGLFLLFAAFMLIFIRALRPPAQPAAEAG